MKVYDLYGYDGGSEIEAARGLIEDLLELRLEKHESSYHCGEYYRKGHDGAEHFILQYNHNDSEDEWTEIEFTQFPIIFYVNETSRSTEIEQRCLARKELKLLRREEL